MAPVDAIVFSGGGSRGAYQLGVYQALHDDGSRLEIVCETSLRAALATPTHRLLAGIGVPRRCISGSTHRYLLSGTVLSSRSRRFRAGFKGTLKRQ